MLKKLSKYGNSTTLVIDKAILELLNMNESGMVRLRTDGRSLIVTPVASKAEGEKVSYDPQEASMALKEAMLTKLGLQDFDPNKLDVSEKTKFEKSKEAFAKVFAKHKSVTTKCFTEAVHHKEYQEQLSLLADKIDPAEHPEAYAQQSNNLIVQFWPEYGSLLKDIQQVYKELA